ncbi:MAG: competence/damage-inducible protein A [Deltaproteobacteria bacterium]|nr:competence/damage-inducible protein A [Deltaproteobacteria bacterium]
MMEKAVILSTGDELITGRVVDTNSAYIADKLYGLGLEVAAVLKVGDSRERLLWALRNGLEMGDLVIGTGGLGPTTDDLTTEIVGEFFGRELRLDEGVAESLRRRFASRGLEMTPNNLKQALFPQGADIVPNPVGSAPGFRVAAREGKYLIWLSGVPREMEAMLKESVLPWVAEQRKGAGEILGCTFKVYGLTESKLGDMLKPIPISDRVRLSYRAHFPDLTLRLAVRGAGEKRFAELAARIRELIGPHIYAEADESLEEIIGRLLLERRWTLALAESCTGGYIGHRITRVPGSSVYFKTSAVTYSNESKSRFLGVRSATLKQHGAVSRETALEMAEGVRRQAEADIGLSVTGIAGPAGGTADKPVGTVWIGLARDRGSDARLLRLAGDRERVILGASQAALHWLRTVLLGGQISGDGK